MQPTSQPNWQNRARFYGHRGGVIAMHRALAHYVLSPDDLITAVLLALLLVFVWILLLPHVCIFWTHILELGVRELPLHTEIRLSQYHLTPFFRLDVPYPAIEPILPDPITWRITAVITVLLLAASFFLPPFLAPIVYLARGILIVQLTAVTYFALLPAEFPQTPASYLEGLLVSGGALISIVPVLFGLTYFIFNFSLAQKGILTLITMGYLVLFLPLQVLLQALILQKTVLFMPLLYVIFGLPLDVLVVISIYSWGMSWPFRSESIS
jgi:hypothetical protein